MKLIFSKDSNQEILVSCKKGENATEFNYISMIKELINVKKLEEPEFDGDFSEAEIESVRSMFNDINQDVTDFYSEDEG